ncbi:energy transducer TonB [Campylobacter mucosalis]|uniref:energy transducer TonB n=1 Tax=Campylobacter mucosalis TaxID=202 RepID=UPI00146FCA60|nr:energy transducer TonB [Campylobacter mucosalis]
MQSRQCLSRLSSNVGFSVSLIIHAVVVALFFLKHPFIEPKFNEAKPLKISVNSFKPISAPVFAPEPSVAPPAPPPPPITKPEPKKITPQEKPKPAPKPKPVKKEKPKPIEKIEPTPPAPPVVTSNEQIATPSQSVTSQNQANTNALGGAPTIGELNMETSANDERYIKIKQALAKHQKYPNNALKLNQQGVVKVSFKLHRDGSVSDIKIIDSSNFSLLDNGAIDTIKKATKDFPRLDNDVVVKIPLAYKLRRG